MTTRTADQIARSIANWNADDDTYSPIRNNVERDMIVAALSPPKPTEGRLAELLAATEFLTLYKDDPERPDDKMTGARVTFGEIRRIIAARTALRAMPLQDHAVTQDKRHD